MRQKKLVSALVGCLSVCSLFSGCHDGIKKEPNQKPTYKVTGSITIDDDIPDPHVQLVAHPKDGAGSGPDKLPSCNSMPDGTFELITYRAGDGAPPGDYVITVTWKEYDLLKQEYRPLDKLKGRYSDPKTSKIEFTVDSAPVNLGTIELTTK